MMVMGKARRELIAATEAYKAALEDRVATTVDIQTVGDWSKAFRSLPKDPNLYWSLVGPDIQKVMDLAERGSDWSVGGEVYFGKSVFESRGGSSRGTTPVRTLKFKGWR